MSNDRVTAPDPSTLDKSTSVDSAAASQASGMQDELFSPRNRGDIMLAFNDRGKSSSTSIDRLAGNSTTVTSDVAPVAEVALGNTTNGSTSNNINFSQEYMELAAVNAMAGGQFGGGGFNPFGPSYGPFNQYGPNPNGFYNSYQNGGYGFNGMGRGNNPYNQGNYYQNPAGPYNGTSITFPLKPTSMDFDPENDGTFNNQTGQLINLADPRYVKVPNPYNSANFQHDASGNPIDPVTHQPLGTDDPRYNPDSDPNNPRYYLQIPNTRSVFNPRTGDVLTSGDPNNPFAPNQNNNNGNSRNGGDNLPPNTNPNNGRNNGGGLGGGGLGGGGLGGLLRIGMLVGVMSLLFRGGGLGGGSFASFLPFLALGALGGGGFGAGGLFGPLSLFRNRF